MSWKRGSGLVTKAWQTDSRATGVLPFSRPTQAQSDITIPAGTICAAMSDSGGLVEFQTDEAVVLAAGTTSAYVEAAAIVAGAAGNMSTGAISIIRMPVVGISSCTNDAAFSGGTDLESDSDLRQRALYIAIGHSV
ncbi:MAG: baseplate J/gp47 family protein [Methanothrix sp.]|nr:baseplate J/gp47 family protein [Methanothrix sp.]